MKGVPRFGGIFAEAPHCPVGLFPGECGFLPGIPGGLPKGAACSGKGVGCLCSAATCFVAPSRLLRFNALSEFSSSSSSSSEPKSLLFSPLLCTSVGAVRPGMVPVDLTIGGGGGK